MARQAVTEQERYNHEGHEGHEVKNACKERTEEEREAETIATHTDCHFDRQGETFLLLCSAVLLVNECEAFASCSPDSPLRNCDYQK